MVQFNDSQQTTCVAMAEINGERRQVASATCSIRPGRGMTFSVDVVEGLATTDEDMDRVADQFSAYLQTELGKARNLYIPV